MVSERPMAMFRDIKPMRTDRGPLGPVFFGANIKRKS
jgi:hypothetical protein